MLRAMLIGLSLISVVPAMALGEELVVYSGREEKFVQPLIDSFTQKTGIKVNMVYGNSSTLLSTLSLDGSKSPADLYMGNDVGNLQRGSDFELFRELSPELLKEIPAAYRSEFNDWIGLSGRLRVLVVNANSPLAGETDSILDLADPRFKDRIAITAGENESFVGGVTAYMTSIGKKRNGDWLRGVKQNAGDTIFGKHSAIVAAVAEGKKDVGLVNHYYALRHLKKESEAPIRILAPDQKSGEIGAAWNMSGIAITRHSRNVSAAERLVGFLVSEEAQKVFAESNMEYPTRPGVPIAKGLQPLAQVRLASASATTLGRERDSTIIEIQRSGLK